MDEAYVRIAGKWIYPFRAIDDHQPHRPANVPQEMRAVLNRPPAHPTAEWTAQQLR